MTARGLAFACLALLALAVATAARAAPHPETTQVLSIREHRQMLHLYGSPGGVPFVVSSGDGGWIHLGPHVAELLAQRGLFVVGFDVKAYLEGFTAGASRLRRADVPRDYATLAEYATRSTGRTPILIGVSEGAGLSILAAADSNTKGEYAGVVCLGLTDINELGWRWSDSLTYLTHRVPNEPTFSAAATVSGVAPLPLALVQSTHDEFVSLADTRRIFAEAGTPKALWIVDSANHRFSDNLPTFDAKLIEAIEWIRRNRP
jgi:fermentation-respiration switch protein FrsA (DUF1100 family)